MYQDILFGGSKRLLQHSITRQSKLWHGVILCCTICVCIYIYICIYTYHTCLQPFSETQCAPLRVRRLLSWGPGRISPRGRGASSASLRNQKGETLVIVWFSLFSLSCFYVICKGSFLRTSLERRNNFPSGPSVTLRVWTRETTSSILHLWI